MKAGNRFFVVREVSHPDHAARPAGEPPLAIDETIHGWSMDDGRMAPDCAGYTPSAARCSEVFRSRIGNVSFRCPAARYAGAHPEPVEE